MQKPGRHDLHGVRRTWKGCCLPLVLWLLLFVPTNVSAVEGNDIGSAALETVGGSRNSQETSSSSSNSVDAVESTATTSTTVGQEPEGATVKRLWGVADTTAIVGKIFQYHIPSDAFSGPVSRFEVSAAGSSDLPPWLRFKAETAILEGIPTESDLGQHYITVEAVGEATSSGLHDHAKDVFSIDVMPANHENSAALPLKMLLSSDELVKCDAGEGITKMALAVDADLQAMTTTNRISLLEDLAKYLHVDKEAIQLLPRKKDNLLDASAVLAGPGNVHLMTTPGAILQWQVGCGGKVDESHQSLVKQVEFSARNGSLSAILKYPVIGWHIAMHTTSLSRRVKRQLHMGYSTVEPAILPVPTRHTIFPDDYWAVKERPEPGFDELEVQPESRVVPSMASPKFSESTYYDPYRHTNHHNANHKPRTKTRGRHQHNHHPTLHPHNPHTNAYYSTPVPTPVLVPIHPTKTTEEPSRAFGEVFPAGTPSIDEQPDVLQTSFFVTTPTFHGTTDVLPTPVITEPTDTSTEDFKPIPPYRPTRPNSKPTIRRRVDMLAFVAGKVFQYQIAENTFHDPEDGNTRNLRLFFMKQDGTSPLPKSWVQFDPKNQTIYGLPMKDHIGTHHFILEAMDASEATVREVVDIQVQQHSLDRRINHEFTLTLDHDSYTVVNLVDRNILLVEKLKRLYGETGPVTNSTITALHAGKESFKWTNDTLVRRSVCPQTEIEEVYSKMVISKNEVTDLLIRTLQPEFRQLRVRVRYLENCKNVVSLIPTAVTPSSGTPKLRNPIDIINATAGEFLNFTIPEDTFYDTNQGQTFNLKLELHAGSNAKMKPSDWIRYDSTLNALVGLPMARDVGTHRFHLVASNRDKKQETEVFVVEVHNRESNRDSVEFSVRLDYDYNTFQSDFNNKILVLDKLTHLFGDNDASNISVLAINRGSVQFAWTNKSVSLSPHTCPNDKISHLLKFLFYDNGTWTRQLVNAFQPEFNITKAWFRPLGHCVGVMTPTTVSHVPDVTVQTEHATSDDDIYISTIIPAVVIAAMLLIAAIVACILYRKKRKGKMTMEDNSTFINKGIPIIFADELEDKSDPAKAPMIMKEEKPPLPPPEYPRASSGSSSPSTPPIDRKDHMDRSAHHHHPHQPRYPSSSNIEHAENSPLYQPPPPFTTNRDSRMNRPKPTPTYRMPPPYVPP